MIKIALQDEVRDDLEEEVFGEFGKTVTLYTMATPTTNDWGEVIGSTWTSSSIVAVPYNIVETRKSEQPFGDLLEGDMDMAVKYNQTIIKGDKVKIERGGR